MGIGEHLFPHFVSEEQKKTDAFMSREERRGKLFLRN